MAASQPINVLVIAHPDDESMFFVPTLCHLDACWIVCLTTGDYDGLGETRAKELQKASKAFPNRVRVRQLHNPDEFPDHPRQKWDIEVVAKALEEALRGILQNGQSCRLFTFDQGGVSGHWNHRDTYFTAQHLVRTTDLSIDSAWCLTTILNPIRKYMPLLEWIRLIMALLWFHNRGGILHEADNGKDLGYRLLRPSLNWKLMKTHWSQFVWYRRLFVIFSCYTYCNRFKRMQ